MKYGGKKKLEKVNVSPQMIVEVEKAMNRVLLKYRNSNEEKNRKDVANGVH